MKKSVAVIAFVFLSCIAVQAQTGGMMGSGMMHEDQGGNTQASQKAITGAEIFNVNCAGCHPHGGNSMVPNLPVKGSKQLVNQRAFVKFIRTPKMPDGSAGAMPAFPKSRISDKQAKELFKYVSSF